VRRYSVGAKLARDDGVKGAIVVDWTAAIASKLCSDRDWVHSWSQVGWQAAFAGKSDRRTARSYRVVPSYGPVGAVECNEAAIF
jgi:hypothetical protein